MTLQVEFPRAISREALNALPIAAELASMKRGLYREIALQQTRLL